MNRKIPFHDLAEIIASKAGVGREEAEQFTKTFFDFVTESLVKGESVKVKGLGTFSLTDDADSPVLFEPDHELSDIVNAPFALFEPEILKDDITDEELEAATASNAIETEVIEVSPEPEIKETVVIPETAPIAEHVKEEKPEPEVKTEPEPVPVPEPAPAPKTEPVAELISKPEPKPAPVPTPIIEEDEEEYITEPEKSGPGFGWGFVVGLFVGIALGACGIYFSLDYLYPTEPRTVIEESVDIPEDLFEDVAIVADDSTAAAAEPQPVESKDTVVAESAVTALEQPETKPVQETAPVKDTVKAGYLLVNMARKHYGDKIFWVYIYEENKAKIKNPNNVNAGTVVVIPPASKYGIDAKNPQSVAKAKAKAGQIMSKYPR
ncbi:MAG: HU family DNA-binding protein [Muribaculaceae bacterium]|nr:HU family DNA-binding protein [Muribaculaceae bacterium]